MNAMGINPTIDYDIISIPNDYDSLLLASDGFTNMVSKKEIEQLIALEGTVKEKVDTMLQRALENGGLDNLAINLMEVDHEN